MQEYLVIYPRRYHYCRQFLKVLGRTDLDSRSNLSLSALRISVKRLDRRCFLHAFVTTLLCVCRAGATDDAHSPLWHSLVGFRALWEAEGHFVPDKVFFESLTEFSGQSHSISLVFLDSSSGLGLKSLAHIFGKLAAADPPIPQATLWRDGVWWS